MSERVRELIRQSGERPGPQTLHPPPLTPGLGQYLNEPESAVGTPAQLSSPVDLDVLILQLAAALDGLPATRVAVLWPWFEAFVRSPHGPVGYPMLALEAPNLMDPNLLARLRHIPSATHSQVIVGVQMAVRSALVARVAAQVGQALAGVDGLVYKNSWTGGRSTTLRGQIVQPQDPPAERRRNTLQRTYISLWQAPLLDELRALTGAERQQVADAVERVIVQRVASVTIDVARREFSQLSNFVQRNIERGFHGYVAARAALMTRFGSVQGINQYYDQMVHAPFLGRNVWVHPVMQGRLQAAERLLNSRRSGGRTWADLARASLRSAGGFNIRENRNSPTNLSLHSFGWAVDLNATTNPNVRSGVRTASPVEELTGLDLEAGPEYRRIRAGGTASGLLGDIRTMHTASSRYAAVFDSEQAMVDGLGGYLEQQGLLHQPWMREFILPTLQRAVGHRRQRDQLREIRRWLQFMWERREDRSPQSEVEEAPICEGPIPPGVDPPDVCLVATLTDAQVAPQALTMLRTYRAFQASRRRNGTEVAARSSASVGSMAAHGFFDLAPELVAALRGSDGGALKWLGVANRTKDFMHFELERPDRPPIEVVAAEEEPAASGESAEEPDHEEAVVE